MFWDLLTIVCVQHNYIWQLLNINNKYMSKKMQLYFDNGQGKIVKYLNNGSNNLKNTSIVKTMWNISPTGATPEQIRRANGTLKKTGCGGCSGVK